LRNKKVCPEGIPTGFYPDVRVTGLFLQSTISSQFHEKNNLDVGVLFLFFGSEAKTYNPHQ
jgi:hypothetical protein